MILSPETVVALLESPANASAIEACLHHEQRLQLHAVPHLDSTRRPLGWRYLRERARSMMPVDEADRWEQCVDAPLPSTDVVEDIFTGLRRVFEAQDGLIHCELATPELETDFEQYRTSQREADFWMGTAFTAVGRRPHSFLVVDMASEQRTPRPEPYSLLVELGDVWDVALREDGTCEYLMFALPDQRENDIRIERVAVYDDAAYMIWRRPEGTQTWAEELNNAHILGYCPARVLWNQPMDKAIELPRQSPLTGVLGKLDKYVFWEGAIEYARLHGTFPITWGFEEECSYKNADGESCQNGVINYIKSYETLTTGEQRANYSSMPCPACKLRPKLGPGTYVTVPAPSKDMPDTRDPVGRVNPDVDVLEHFRAIQQQRRQDLLRSVLGGGGEPENQQAQNQKQVMSGFEIKQDVLVEFKKPLEEARAWDLRTKGRLRYGNLFRSATVNMGERFYLKTPEQLAKEEEETRKSGRPVYELSQQRTFRYQTLYRNNPAMLDRMQILSDLEPYPEYSVDQILTMLTTAAEGSYVLTLFDANLLRLKVDFGRYLTRFESEQMDVRRFASLQPYHIKLASITQILLSYVNESQNGASGQSSRQTETRPQNAPGPAA
ncbi:hypothetical protein [Hymenobacter sp. YC55]|uniref:hypothetical protein n=1 Tax=Hymenobacter sp. YC55 TaxID=3034019 RepID=UPI0023F7211E|nr:hypothetical protein [Hymenobacter sp. YC55]MDF7810714.1 hypothetical protein [Hymenobacter sp. YC55]